MSDDRDIGYAIFGFFSGIWLFFRGFQRLRRKRLIENIPTSTIRGMAMGLVELYGKAGMSKLLKSPLTGTECVLYQYLVEEYRSSGKSGHWVKIASGDSFYSPFWLDDGTGKVMIFSKGAEVILPADYEFSMSMGRSLPQNLISFMESNAISYKSWLGTRTLRFREWFIMPRESVYVIGSAKKTETSNINYKEELMSRIAALKKDPVKMKDVDLNRDGVINVEEWDLAVSNLEREALEKTLSGSEMNNPADVIIGKGEEETMFMISDSDEKDLIRNLTWKSFAGIYGGSALSIALLVYLLFRFNLLRF